MLIFFGGNMITATTGSNYCHVGMYIGYVINENEYKIRLKENNLVKDKKLKVRDCKSKINIPLDFKTIDLIIMESLDDQGVSFNKLSKTFNDYKININTKNISFIRMKNINLDKRNEIIETAFKKIGGNYSNSTIFSSIIAVLSTAECNFINLLKNITLLNIFYYSEEESKKNLTKCYENSYKSIQKTLVFVGPSGSQAQIHWKTKLRRAGGKQVEHKGPFWRLPTFQGNMKHFCKIRAPAGVLQ